MERAQGSEHCACICHRRRVSWPNPPEPKELIAGRLRDFMEHPTPADLASYVDGRMSQAERNRADEHLARCTECQRWLAGTVKTIIEIAGGLNGGRN